MFYDEFDYIKGEVVDLKIVEKRPEDKEKGYCPMYIWHVMKDNQVVGEVLFRIGFNENIYYGGNIGITIFEEYRGNRYAGFASKMLLKVAKKHNIKEIYVTCNPDNIASKKTIETNINCQFVERALIPKHNDQYEKGMREKLIYKLVIE